MRLFSLLSSAALLLVAGSAQAASSDTTPSDAALARALAGRTAGEPVDCLNLHSIRSSRIIDRTAILYETAGGTIYVNRPRAGARSLDRDDILVTRTVTSRLCSIDVVRLFDRMSRFETGFVSLGAFVPYTKTRAKTAN